MDMDLTGIKNQNEYYTNHYFTSIFKENAEEAISAWRQRAKEEEITLSWHDFRDIRRQYNIVREQYLRMRGQENSKPLVQEMAELYLKALGYGSVRSVTAEVADGLTVPVFHEEMRANGAPLMWTFLSVFTEEDDDILNGYIFSRSEDEEERGETQSLTNDEILAKLFFAGEEAPRFIILIGINQIALIDRNKWNEKRYLQFMLDDIFGRHEETTFMAVAVLLHKESLCPADGGSLLDSLDENSHKHSAGVSDALKYALRESIEILGNEVIYDMRTRQGIDLESNPVDAEELTLECLRYMYRFLFMLFIEARPELGYAPMKSQAYVQGYSLEGLRDVCARVKEESEVVGEGYYICDTISELFKMIYEGYPRDLEEYKKAVLMESSHDMFTVEALKAHIFDPEYTPLLKEARLRNSAMLRIVDLMSISRPKGSRERKGRISYSALGINQMGAVYEALLSYRGFIAKETLYEVKRANDDFDELNVGYFIPESELGNYTQEERVREKKNDPTSPLRKYEKGTFIYRLAGREREKSASYYTPEVLTRCLVKYALKELLEGKSAEEILNLTICEPAMGSAAFLNEAINQLAEGYLTKRQEETGEPIAYDERFEKLQQVKMYIADRNVYGVDLNPIAVELAEVSLWLNTIYKGAYVPWFGTQLVCGNSLIGARKQVYSQTQLANGKWYEAAPRRIEPHEKRTKKGQHENTKEIYHFLLGDPGMANYTDKVVKGLEPENIKKFNDWRKEFTKKYDEDDIKTLLSLSEIIDTLWDKTVELRGKVEKATAEPFSIYGHEEASEGAHTTIREKDAIYQQLFKSEHMTNAGPYARLKAAMDYWCALWFWPIDKADLLPSRQIFFMEMYMILQGAVNTSLTNSSAQMTFIDSSGQTTFDENGRLELHTTGQQLALDFTAEYADLGLVNLDDLRERNERFRIANKIAKEQRFHHWELEFADVFEERGGFDLVIGNPPWIKVEWNEQALLAEYEPLFAVRKFSATQIAKERQQALQNGVVYREYMREYTGTEGTKNFLNAVQNYGILEGQKANLYKCFLPLSWQIGTGVEAFVHPEGVYDDPHGGALREMMYARLRKHFMFANERKLFPEVDHHTQFSLNVYGGPQEASFDTISNLYDPVTIEACYRSDGAGEIPLMKNAAGDWNTAGHLSRIIHVTEKELLLFARLFDGNEKWRRAKLPTIFVREQIDVLEMFANQNTKIANIQKDIYTTQFWNETIDQDNGIIVAIKDGDSVICAFPERVDDSVYSAPNVGILNPYNSAPRRLYRVNSDYDRIDLTEMPEDYLLRCRYRPCEDRQTYYTKIPESQWGKITENFRLVSREFVGCDSERTLTCAIAACGIAHVHAVFSVSLKNGMDMACLAGCEASIPYDFFVRCIGKRHINQNTYMLFPMLNAEAHHPVIARALLLNCLTVFYRDLWKRCWRESYKHDAWAKSDPRLRPERFTSLSDDWNWDTPLRTDYERREALVELDVLVSMALGMSLEQLKTIYRIQFPVLQSYEVDTWYDRNGRIVFTNNRSLTGVGLSRQEFDEIKNWQDGTYTQTKMDDTMPGGPVERKIEYVAPFDRCDRIADYEEVWRTFEERFAKGGAV